MTLNLLKADIDMRHMAHWSAVEGHSDSARALHCLVFHTFGPHRAPRTFAAIENPERPREHATLLAYSTSSAEELQEVARANQSALTAGIMNPHSFRSTPVPDSWHKGTTLRFQVRTIPTFRPRGSSIEVDLHRKYDASPTREETYHRWLSRIMADKGGADAPPHAMELIHYNTRSIRRSPVSPVMTVPDVTIQGTCTIDDPEKWNHALTVGVGRHKAYGYGMLLLSSASS